MGSSFKHWNLFTSNMGGKFTKEQVAEAKAIFAVYDKDGDDSIDAKELGTVLKQLKFGDSNPSDADLAQMIKEVDKDKNGKLKFAEFLTLLAGRKTDKDKEAWKKLHEEFLKLDKNGDGKATRKELLEAVKDKYDWSKTVAELLLDTDYDGDGKITYQEFVTMIITTNH